MKITAIHAYQVDLPLHEGRYNWSGGNFVAVFDSHGRGGRDRRRPHRLGRGLPARARLPAGLRQRRARRHRRSSGRTCSASTRASSAQLNRRMDQALQGPSLREVGASTSPAGTSSARRRACRWRRCWAAATARTSRSTAPSRRRRPKPWRQARRRLPRRGLPQVPAQGRRRPRRRHRAHPRLRARCCKPGDVLVADANTGWTDARGGARGATRCATSTSTSSSPARPTRSACAVRGGTRPALRARRGHRRLGDAACAAMPTGRWT